MDQPKLWGPALFLDRDGVVNCERGYVCQPDDLVFEPAFWPLAQAAHHLGMPCIIITNQGGIGKGLMTEADLTAIHQRLLDGFAKHALPAPHIYYCPHHPDGSLCLCRKPSSLWFARALARHRITPVGSWMIGDRERDLMPAQSLGISTVLVGEGPNPHADLYFPTMDQVAAWFLDKGFQATTTTNHDAHVRAA